MGAQAKAADIVTEGRRRSESLSQRERDALTWAARGLTAEQSSSQMGVTEGTVKDHRKNALRRMGAVCLAQAIVIALKRGEISLEQI